MRRDIRIGDTLWKLLVIGLGTLCLGSPMPITDIDLRSVVIEMEADASSQAETGGVPWRAVLLSH